eukprot:12076547-Ditylum_brightwellii.AAC.2
MASLRGPTASELARDIKVQQDGTFQMYLELLDKWESSLLQNVDVKYLIHQVIMELGQGNFLIITDGSSGSDSMPFGWKMCTLQGQTLVQHVGPAYGQTSLFRSEAYGILSTMRVSSQEYNNKKIIHMTTPSTHWPQIGAS